jgi:hypothetical protein
MRFDLIIEEMYFILVELIGEVIELKIIDFLLDLVYFIIFLE